MVILLRILLLHPCLVVVNGQFGNKMKVYPERKLLVFSIARGGLTLVTNGDVPLESEKWTLSDTKF